MTVSTCGKHCENAAQALNVLICADMITSAEQEVDRLLHCREAVVDALRQRLYDVGQVGWYSAPDDLAARTPRPVVAGLDEKLANQVDNIAFALSTLPFDERCTDAAYLASASDGQTAEFRWAAAVEVMSASHAVSATEKQPWCTDPGDGCGSCATSRWLWRRS